MALVVLAVGLGSVLVVRAPVAESRAPDLRVSGAVASEGADAAAVYLTIDNRGGRDDLVAVSSPAGAGATLHGYDQRNAMTDLVVLAVPAEGQLQLRPGGTHVMLTGLRAPLPPGSSVALRLMFRRAPPVVRPTTAVPPMSGRKRGQSTPRRSRA